MSINGVAGVGQVGNAGGLVGQNYGTISQSYANGAVAGTSAGGLVGAASGGSIDTSYWDTTVLGQPAGCGAASTVACGGVTGLTTAQMQDPANFVGFAIDTVGGQGLPWRIYAGQTSPLLGAFLQTITVQPGSLAKVY